MMTGHDRLLKPFSITVSALYAVQANHYSESAKDVLKRVGGPIRYLDSDTSPTFIARNIESCPLPPASDGLNNHGPDSELFLTGRGRSPRFEFQPNAPGPRKRRRTRCIQPRNFSQSTPLVRARL